MRPAHWLRKNHKTELPSHLLFFDCESKQRKTSHKCLTHELTFGYAAYVRRVPNGGYTKPTWQRFDSPDQFYDFLSECCPDKSKLYVFCHNTNFDLPLTDVFGYMKAREYTLKGAVIDGPPTILNFRREKQTVVFLDSLNIFRMPLAALGRKIGLLKYEEKDEDGNMVYDDKRCRRDVEIIMKAVLDWIQFIRTEDLGGFAHTLAGQSMRAYRHRFMDHDILIDSSEDGLLLARDSYSGGRTEAFKIGKLAGPLTLLDVNSMYPSVMRGHDYPAIFHAHWKRVTVKELQTALTRYSVTARCRIRTDDPAYAVRTPDRLVFPVGEFTAVLSTPELRYACAHNHILSVDSINLYHPAPIFDKFVDYFHSKKEAAKAAGEDAKAEMYKTLLNSLYGKYGQKGTVWESEFQTDDLSSRAWTEVIGDPPVLVKHRRLGGLVQTQAGEVEARDSHPAIAAHVCAYGRIKLWELIKQAGRENVFYCDTDSLLVNDSGLTRLRAFIDPLTLGSLGIQHKMSSAEIFGPKDYIMGRKAKTKGVKKNARKYKDGRRYQDQWSSLKGLLRKGSITAPTTKRIKKTLARVYTKGRVTSSGWVEPFLLGLQLTPEDFRVKAGQPELHFLARAFGPVQRVPRG